MPIDRRRLTIASWMQPDVCVVNSSDDEVPAFLLAVRIPSLDESEFKACDARANDLAGLMVVGHVPPPVEHGSIAQILH